MNLSARYKFKQPADPAMVAVLVAAERAGKIAPDGLPGSVYELRRQMAESRRHLPTWRGADSIALLKDLARIDRQLEECEEALDVILAECWRTGPHGQARCPRCHHKAPTAGHRMAAHTSSGSSTWCSGSGAVFKRSVAALIAHFPGARRIVIIDNHGLLVNDTRPGDRDPPLSVTVAQSKRGMTGRYSIDPDLEQRADLLLEQLEDGAVEIHKDRHGPQGMMLGVARAPTPLPPRKQLCGCPRDPSGAASVCVHVRARLAELAGGDDGEDGSL